MLPTPPPSPSRRRPWATPGFHRDLNLLAQPPPNTLKETCFFWYHGNHRRENCGYAHETYVTWPISNSPGFVHYEACHLPLCPLKHGLRELQAGIVRRPQYAGESADTGTQDAEVKEDVEMTMGQEESDGEGNSGEENGAYEYKQSLDNNEALAKEMMDEKMSGEKDFIAVDDCDPLPAETCFFWYHKGQCRRGVRCHLAHEIREGVIVSAPPKYNGARHVGCHLVLCPVKEAEDG